MISASVAQIPGLAAIFLYMLGAELSPVALSLFVSSAGVAGSGSTCDDAEAPMASALWVGRIGDRKGAATARPPPPLASRR